MAFIQRSVQAIMVLSTVSLELFIVNQAGFKFGQVPAKNDCH
jgi:hypothetical protein